MAISDWMELRNVLLWSVSIGSSWEHKGKKLQRVIIATLITVGGVPPAQGLLQAITRTREQRDGQLG